VPPLGVRGYWVRAGTPGSIAWIAPLMHETILFIDEGAGSLCFRIPVDGVRAGSRNDVVESGSRPMVWWVGRHPSREGDLRQVEIISA
jgi:hypothetical protein